jgi:UDP-GlcNAc3NAcA epimerase
VRILSVVGTRPQLIKAAALQPTLRAHHEEIFVDTGQHYDDSMAGSFFRELGLAPPEHSLRIGGGPLAEQMGRMMIALEPILASERPDAVVVYGDTNSTLAGALSAALLGIPVAHVEAGLRSFDRRMPEELNRIVADHLATWCFAPTPTAVANLATEGITAKVTLVGDLMQDLVARVGPQVQAPSVLGPIHDRLRADSPHLEPLRPGGYLFATIHRRENREPAAITRWMSILAHAARSGLPVILPIHPGTAAAMQAAGVSVASGVHAVNPVGYRSALALEMHAAAVITDSGGIQREAAWLGTPCLVLRGTTEWVEAVGASRGQMVVIGLDPDRAASELRRLAPIGLTEGLALSRAAAFQLAPAGAAEAIVDALEGAGERT